MKALFLALATLLSTQIANAEVMRCSTAEGAGLTLNVSLSKRAPTDSAPRVPSFDVESGAVKTTRSPEWKRLSEVSGTVIVDSWGNVAMVSVMDLKWNVIVAQILRNHDGSLTYVDIHGTYAATCTLR